MSYREQTPSTWLGPLPRVSWTLVTAGVVFIGLATVSQLREAAISQNYDIRVNWFGLGLTLAVFLSLELAAFFAARARHYGVSIWFAAFVVGPLAIGTLFQLAQVGM